MDLEPFRLDIDELINEFAESGMTLLSEVKTIWLSKKFSLIYEAKPSTKLGFFMQSLYAHCLGYMTSTDSISHRLGGLYCLYCLHQTQPFKPPFRIYLSPWQLKRLEELVMDAKNENIGIVSILVNSMLEKHMFLYGAIDLKEGSTEERVNELIDLEKNLVQRLHKKLFADHNIERYIHMDMGKELDLGSMKQFSTDYAKAKELAIKEAGNLIDTENIKHIVENQTMIVDVVRKTTEDWNTQKETFYQKTGLNPSLEQQNRNGNLDAVEVDENLVVDDDACEENKNFSDELEQLLSLTEY